MSASQGPEANEGGKRRAQARAVAEECLRRRAAGESLTDDQILAAHPDIAAELAEELAKARLIGQARRAADEAPTMSEASGPPLTSTAGQAGRGTSAEGDATAGQAGRGTPPGAASDAEDEGLPPSSFKVPGYSIIREISRGGQAVVFEALQESTGRKVAVKVLREGPFLTARQRARFDREVQILAALKHPNIVSIIDRGATEHGAQYLVMDYIEGRTLDQYLADYRDKHGDAPLDPSQMLRLFLKIADAVNAAHLRGIVHRDLKPSNIRIDGRGEPHILDFGLAAVWAVRSLTDEIVPQPVTLTGQFLGSLPWASPEQAEGLPDKIDIRSDVYSLGVVLYQMLTGGHFPYEVAGTMRDVLNNIITVAPTPPSQMIEAGLARKMRGRRGRFRRRKAVNEVIEAIVLKSLAKGPEQRYQSAGDFARDIGNYLSGQPTIAAGMAALRRQRRSRLVRAAAVAGGIVAACLLTAVVMLTVILPRYFAPAPPVLPPAVAPPNTLTDAEKAAGWRLLFDGTTLAGWRVPQKNDLPTAWSVVDGTLSTDRRMAPMITQDKFDNFELDLEWKIAGDGESVVTYRATEDHVIPLMTGPSVSLADDEGRDVKGSSVRWSGGCHYLYAPAQKAARPAGQWNRTRVVAVGNQVEHWVNGAKVLEYELGSEDFRRRLAKFAHPEIWAGFGTAPRGHIGLCSVRPGSVAFRNVKIRPLGAAPAAAAPPAAAPAPATVPQMGPTIRPGQWVDLLALVDPSADAGRGKWERSGGFLLARQEWYSRLLLPVVVDGSYELSVSARDPGGKAAYVMVLLPVGASCVRLECSTLNHRPRLYDSKTPPEILWQEGTVSDAECRVDVKVLVDGDQGEITALVDGKPGLHWKGRQSDLDAGAMWKPSRPSAPGLGTHNELLLYTSAKLRMLSGEARLLRPPPAGVPYLSPVTETAPPTADHQP